MDEHSPPPPHPIDERVGDALRVGIAAIDADAGPPRPDRADLARRTRRRSQRRQVTVGVAAAAALVLGVAGGWMAGREDAPAIRAEASTPDTREPTSTEGIEVVASPQLPTAVPADREGETGEPAAPFTAPTRRAPSYSSGLSYWPSPWWPGTTHHEPTARLYRRTADGAAMDVRANRLPTDEDPGWGQDVPFADPPAWCFPSGQLYVGLRTPGAVGQMWGPRFTALRPDTLHVTGSIVGGAEDELRWLALVQVPDGVRIVTAHFPGGGSDTMAPAHGVAALTAPVDESVDLANPYVDTPDVPPLRVVGTGAAGGDITFEGAWWGTDGSAAASGSGSPLPFDPACTPPHALPDPGPTQPSDPAASEAAIRDTWDTAFNRDRDDDTVIGLVDDPDGVDVALEELRTSGYAPEIRDAASVVLDDIVFADATTAYVRYRVEVEGMGTPYDNRYGAARLVGGTWKITRATACGVLKLGLGTCPPKDD